MTGSNRIDRHAKLVDQMAATVGIDIDESVQRAELPADQVRDAVHTCIGCTNVQDCEHWLKAHADGADNVPEYCRNSHLFADLAGKAE